MLGLKTNKNLLRRDPGSSPGQAQDTEGFKKKTRKRDFRSTLLGIYLEENEKWKMINL